jgi:hypothetical protein
MSCLGKSFSVWRRSSTPYGTVCRSHPRGHPPPGELGSPHTDSTVARPTASVLLATANDCVQPSALAHDREGARRTGCKWCSYVNTCVHARTRYCLNDLVKVSPHPSASTLYIHTTSRPIEGANTPGRQMSWATILQEKQGNQDEEREILPSQSSVNKWPRHLPLHRGRQAADPSKPCAALGWRSGSTSSPVSPRNR